MMIWPTVLSAIVGEPRIRSFGWRDPLPRIELDRRLIDDDLPSLPRALLHRGVFQ